MQRFLLLFYIFIAAKSVFAASGISGSVELDELSFDKLVNKFDVSLVKFDVAFPYGDKHEAFVALAKESKNVEELLVAEVGVKDYGEKDNEALALKYGASKENFPAVRLFIKGNSEPISFDDSKGFTSDELRRFVRENTGVYLSLPGCIKSLDLLAIKFMKTNKEDDIQRKKIIKEAEDEIQNLPGKDASAGKIYKLIMEKILEKGDEFVNTEAERVKKLLTGKISFDKKKELTTRINILQTFQLRDNKDKTNKKMTKEDL